MKPNYNYQHHDTGHDFQQSLNQLEDILQVDSANDKAITEVNLSKDNSETNRENLESIDLETKENAITDIEQDSKQKTEQITTNQQVNNENIESIDMEAWEDAIADIEQFLAHKEEE